MKLLKIFLMLSILTTRLSAQSSFKVIHTFSELSTGNINSDGAQPYLTGAVLAGDRLYGTTYRGGPNGCGVIYSLNTNGDDFTLLHPFTSAHSPDYTNLDGQFPVGGLMLSGDTLYGTSLNGGTNSGGYGTLYSLNTNGSNFSRLQSFDRTQNGSNPHGPMVSSNGRLYGVTEAGGSSGNGTVFSLNPDGTDFTLLHTLSGLDGNLPYAGLLLIGDTLYGTADYGGAFGNGTVFSVKTNGDNWTLLHAFSDNPSPARTNFDGTSPQSALVTSGSRLFGTTVFGGNYDKGTLFSLNTNGSDFTVLHQFTGGSDGTYPMGLLCVGNVLYGVAESGGTTGRGTIYSIQTDGSDFNVMHTFASTPIVIGNDPEGALVMSGNTLYGTTEFGGTGSGTVFSFTIAPSITAIHLDGNNLLINAINGVSGQTCYVMTSTNVTAPFIEWMPVATNLLSGGSFSITATNAVNPAAPQQFYALKVQ